MLCSEYEKLTTIEKVIFIGELQHACQSDNELFEMANKLLSLAIVKGLFKNVTILPHNNISNE